MARIAAYGGPSEIDYLEVFGAPGDFSYAPVAGEKLAVPVDVPAVSNGRTIALRAYLVYVMDERAEFADFTELVLTMPDDALAVHLWHSNP